MFSMILKCTSLSVSFTITCSKFDVYFDVSDDMMLKKMNTKNISP